MADDIGFNIYAVVGGLQSSLNDASNSIKQFSQQAKQQIETVGTAFEGLKGAAEFIGIGLGVSELISFGKESLEAADSLYILSQRTGIAASTLSALTIPLEQNGSSVQDFAGAIRFMNRNIEQGAEGNKKMIDIFDQLGLSITKLKALTPEEQFYAISTALGKVDDQGKLTNDTMAIFGRSGAGLIPIIKEANGNIEEMVKTTKDLGGALTDEEITKVHEYEDGWISLTNHLKIGIVEATLSLKEFFRTVGEGVSSSDLTDKALDGVQKKVQADKDAAIAAYSDKLAAGGFTGVQDNSKKVDKSAKGNNDDIQKDDGGKAAADAEKLQEQLDNLETQTALTLAREKFAGKKDLLDQEVAAGQISKTQEVAQLQTALDTEYQLEMTALTNQMNAWDKGTLEYQKALDARLILQQKYENDKAKLGAEGAKIQAEQEKSITSTIQRSFDTMLTGILQGTQTWQQAMARLFSNLAITAIEAAANMAVKWAVHEAMKTTATVVGVGERTTAQAAGTSTGLAMEAAAAVKSVSVSAAKAAASVYASVASIPYVGWLLAPPAAAAAFVAVEAFGGSISSASGGFDIPYGTNPMTQLHSQEMVLPANLANKVRNMTDGGGDSGTTVHIHLNAIDSQSGIDFLHSQGETIANVINQQLRMGNPALSSQSLSNGRY